MARKQDYIVQVVQNMGNSDDQERNLKAQMSQLASMLGMGVPTSPEQYDGILGEAAKRFRIRVTTKTYEEMRKLHEQKTATTAAYLNFLRTNSQFARLPKENAIRNLELDARESELLFEIEKTNKAREDLRKPKTETSRRGVSPFYDEDKE
jgi:hypothetical protein